MTRPRNWRKSWVVDLDKGQMIHESGIIITISLSSYLPPKLDVKYSGMDEWNALRSQVMDLWKETAYPTTLTTLTKKFGKKNVKRINKSTSER